MNNFQSAIINVISWSIHMYCLHHFDFNLVNDVINFPSRLMLLSINLNLRPWLLSDVALRFDTRRHRERVSLTKLWRSVVAPRRIIRSSNLFMWPLIIIEWCPSECTLPRDRSEIKITRRCLSPRMELAQFRAPCRTVAIATCLRTHWPTPSSEAFLSSNQFSPLQLV